MGQHHAPSTMADVPVEPGWVVYDSEGRRVGIVDDVCRDQDAVSIRQAGLILGWFGDEFVVPRPLVADAYEDSITLSLTAEELEAHRVARN